MSDDNATLRDALIEGQAKAAEVKAPEKKAEPDAAAIAAAAANADALEVGKLLIDSGYTKEKVNELLAAPGALNSLRYLIQNNPSEFLNVLEKTDPTTGEKFLESMADTYVKRYAPKDAPKTADGKKAEVPAELLNAVEDLRGQIKDIKSKEDQKNAAAAMAQVQARYNARVDDMFGQLPKDLGLTKAETKALRAQLQQELSEDPSAVQRISNGNFVDVPNKFKTIIEGFTGDRKAAADAEKNGREKSSGNANVEFLGGPQPFIPDMPNGFADSWDNTEDAFAKALVKASR